MGSDGPTTLDDDDLILHLRSSAVQPYRSVGGWIGRVGTMRSYRALQLRTLNRPMNRLLPRGGGRRSLIISNNKSWLSTSGTSRTAPAVPAAAHEYIFTLAEYKENNDIGLGKGSQFCFLALKHPLITADYDANDEIYKTKKELWPSRAEEIFMTYDKDASGTMDAEELKEALEGIGLPPTDEKVKEILDGPNYGGKSFLPNHVGSLNLPQLSNLLQDTWGQGVAVTYYTTEELEDTWQYYRGSSSTDAGSSDAWATAWVGRMPPAHFMLRALRWTWPGSPVKSVAIMRNTCANPDLDPEHMKVHDDTYFPSVEADVSTVVRLARFATQFDPFEEGGFVVRIEEEERTFYVPFVALPVNGSTPIGPQVGSFDKALYALPFGLGLAMLLFAIL